MSDKPFIVGSDRDSAARMTLEGNALYEQGEVVAAEKLYREAFNLTGDAIAANNVAIALVHLGRFDESEAWFEKAHRLLPDDWRTRTGYGEMLFRAGRWLEAWKYWQPVIENPFEGGGEQWNGQDLAGKEVLVTPAGGYGDVFMFARYIPELAKRFGCKVSWAANEDMVPVFVNQPSMAGVNMKEKRDWEIWMHLFHFPLLFQMTPETVLWNGPYIEPIELDDVDTLRIGIKLGAGEKGDKFKFRSMPGIVGEELLAALPETVDLIPLTARNEMVHGWLDTIALISTCDLVMAVDTATLHLAAAMGKPTWALLGDFNDAKWGKSGATTPWYPTMKIFRGEGKGWKHTVDQVIDSLGIWLQQNWRAKCHVATT